MTGRRVRRPAVAGAFYPANPGDLRSLVEAALQEAVSAVGPAGGRPPPKAIVVPHAGYRYSGRVAASAYALLVPVRGRVERVVLLGPAHRFPLTAVAASSADAFETPLGLLPVDTQARDELVAARLVVVDDDAHAAEHSLEVQLPFLQVALGGIRVLPLVVGQAPAAAVVAVLDAVWGGPETAVVVSTDLSHHHDRGTAERLDRLTVEAVVDRQPEAIGLDAACGVFPLRGLLLAARRRDLDVDLLDLRTSADAGGDEDSVVGYGAFAL